MTTATWVNAISSPRNSIAPPRSPMRAERGEQADAGDRRRQHERQLDSGDEQRAARGRSATRSGTRPASRRGGSARSRPGSSSAVTTSASTAAGLVMPSSSWPSGIWRKIARIGSRRKARATAVASANAAPNRLLTEAPKPACLSSRLPSAPSRSAMNSSAPGSVLRALHDRDLVPNRRLRARGQRNRDQPRRRGADVGRVDEARRRPRRARASRRCPSRPAPG